MSQQQPPQGPPQGYGPPSGGYGPPPSGYGPPQGYPGQYAGYPPQPPPKPSWYHSSLILAASLFFCWPVGLILLWTSKATSMVVKVLNTAVFGGLGLLFTIGAMAGGNKTATSSTPTTFNASSPVTTTEPTRQAAPEPTVEAVSESCLALATKFGTESKLSDLQKDELWKAYAGKSFEWELKITEVSAGMLGGFSVQAKCSPSSPSLIQDVHLSYDGDAKSFVMGLQKDGKYKLKGILKSGSPHTLVGARRESPSVAIG